MYNLEIPGWMSKPELQTIEKWARLVPKNGSIVEVGSFLGRSSICWALSADPSVTVYCLDTYDAVTTKYTHTHTGDASLDNNYPPSGLALTIEAFEANTQHIKNIVPMVVPLKVKDYSETIKNLTPNLVFLDAGHKNPSDMDMIRFWLKRIQKGGILCGHDYLNEKYPHVTSNVGSLRLVLGIEPEIHYSLWMFRV